MQVLYNAKTRGVEVFKNNPLQLETIQYPICKS